MAVNEYGEKQWEQEFKDGVLIYGKTAGKMVHAKIGEKGGRADLLNLSDIDLTADELRQIDKSLHPEFKGRRGGFGMSRK